MVTIKLNDIGKVEIDKRLKAELTITTRELFEQFSEAAAKLSSKAKDIIYLAVDRKEDPKVKKQENEIRNFFLAVEAKSTRMKLEEAEPEKEEKKGMGFAEEEKVEEEEAEELKAEEMEETEIKTLDSDEEVVVETVDEETGEVEGELTIEEDTESKLVPIVIKEKYEAFYKNDGEQQQKILQVKDLLSWKIFLKMINCGI